MMDENGFRMFLAPRLGLRSVSSYVSNCARVQRLLGIDLDTCDLSAESMLGLRDRLYRQRPRLPDASLSNCLSAVRGYAEFRGVPGDEVPAARPRDTRPTVPPPPARDRPEHVRAATIRELLVTYADLLEELRAREIVRTGNSPVGDYAETLFARAFGWKLEGNSYAGYDALDLIRNEKVQIKARRMTRHNASRQVSAIRRLPERTFDTLAAVLLGEDFSVKRAALIPHEVVARNAKRTEHTNSWRFLLEDRIWLEPGVSDVTAELRQAADDL